MANKKTIGDDNSSDEFWGWFSQNHAAAWHWRAIRLDHAIRGDYTGHGTTLALSDDGLYGAHIGAFSANYLPQLSYDYVNNSGDTISGQLLNAEGKPDGNHGALVANLAIGAPAESADTPDDFGILVQTFTNVNQLWYIDPYEGGVASDGQFFAISGLSQSLALWTEGYTPPEVDVVNMSWGDTSTFGAGLISRSDGNGGFVNTLGQNHDVDPLFEFAADAGRDGKGTILVNSAGNNRNTTINLNGEAGVGGPSNSRIAIVVGAVENNHAMAGQLTGSSGNWGLDRDYTDYRFAYWSENSGSSYGANLLVSTPGDELVTFIASLDNSTGSGTFYTNEQTFNGISPSGTGTSSAAPIVSGAVMLMLEANPNLGWRDVQDILADSSWMIDKGTANSTDVSDFDATDHDWGASGGVTRTKNGEAYQFNRDYGYGMLDAGGAVRLAEYWDLLRDPRDSHNETVLAVTIEPDNNSTWSTVDFGSIAENIEIDHVSLYLEQFDVTNPNSSLVLTHNGGVTTTLFDGLIYSQAALGSDNGNYTDIDWDFMSQQFRGDTSAGTWGVSLTGGDLGERAILKIYGDESEDDIFVVTNDYNNSWSAGLHGGSGTDSLNFSALSMGTDYTTGTGMTGSDAELVHTYSPVRVNLGAQHTVHSTAASALGISSGTLNATQASFMLSSGTKSFTTISGIENIVGSWGNDVLAGDGEDNLLIGSAGNDYLFGAGGDDQLIGGMYNRASQQSDTDYLNGGAGSDTLDLSHLTRLVSVDRTFVSADGTTMVNNNIEYVADLKNTIDEVTTTATIDVSITLNNAAWAPASMVEVTDVVTSTVILSYSGRSEGTASDPTTTQSSLSTSLSVMDVENIYFGDGDDTFVGDTSANLVRPGLGAGTFDGGSQGMEEVDTFDLSTFSTDLVIQDATNNTAKEAAIPAGGVPTSNLGNNASTANINATFSNFESLLLGAGNDLIELNSSEISNVDGGAGYDLLFFTDTTGITLDLSETGEQMLDSTTKFTLNSIEGVQGTAQADTITGNDADNLFLYSGGADKYYGGAGDDALVLYGSSASAAVSVTLWDTNAEGVATAVVGGSTNVQLHGIESLYGGSGNDVFYGDAKSNTFRPGGGANTFHGGSGHDTIDLQDQATGLIFNFSTATPAGGFISVGLGSSSVGLRSVEAIIGTTAADTVTIGDKIDTVYTGWGADRVFSTHDEGVLIADGVLGNLAITSISAVHTLTEADMNRIYGEQRHARVGNELERDQSGTITSTIFDEVDLGLDDHAMVEITLDELSYISMLEFTESFYAIGMVDEQGIETVSLRQTPKGDDQSNWYFELTDTAVQSLRIYGDTNAVDSIDQRSFRILGYTDDTRDDTAGFDQFIGGDGDDTMIFSDGTNYARGGDGNDILVGGAGIDYLIGDTAATSDEGTNDLLIGGSSPIRSTAITVDNIELFGDRLEGGYGDDTYVVAWNQGITTISDIAGEDTIILTETDSRTLRLENIYININNFRKLDNSAATSKNDFAKFDLEMYFVTANTDAYLSGPSDNIIADGLQDVPKIIFEDFAEKDGSSWVSNYEHIKHIGDMSRDFAFVDNIISVYINNQDFDVTKDSYESAVTSYQSYLPFIDPY